MGKPKRHDETNIDAISGMTSTTQPERYGAATAYMTLIAFHCLPVSPLGSVPQD